MTTNPQRLPTIATNKGKIPAVVGWLDNGVGPSLCRALFKHGVPIVALVRNKNNVECKTRYVKHVIEVPEGDAGIIDALNANSNLFPEGAVFCPTNDALAHIINSQQKRLSSTYKIGSPDPATLALLGDKSKVNDLLARAKILHPKTCSICSKNEIPAIVEGCRYPVIVKPSVKSTEWWDALHKKAIRAESPESLIRILNRCLELAPSLIVQEWIDGPDSNMYSFYSYVGKNGNLLAGLTCQKLRQAPAATGVGSIAMQCEEPRVSEPSLRLIQESGFRGLSSMQFKRREGTQDYYFIEANVGRPGLNTPVAEACGVELQYTMYCDCADLPLPTDRYVRFPGAKAVVWKLDLNRSLEGILSGEISVLDWLSTLTGRVRSIDIHLDDPNVLSVRLIRSVKKNTRKMAARLLDRNNTRTRKATKA
ncbi:MAG: hypothetical protein JJ934_15235 [Pseudomonadales bacterium]|nr:hypothetical protein [Pseudomonadales bacterium]